MDNKCVLTRELEVLDDKFFTKDRYKEWYNLLLGFAVDSINLLREETGNINGIAFEVNTVMLHEAIYDAIVGMKTIVMSFNNTVEEPNPFKIASYLGYWFLKHKPIVFRAASNLDIDKVITSKSVSEAKAIIMDIKHLNEVAVARFLLRYIFVIDNVKPICNKCRFKTVKNANNLSCNSFNEMLTNVFDKLKYHLTYRSISPKVIEHFLEAYTLHPYLPYTCDLWNTENDNKNDNNI